MRGKRETEAESEKEREREREPKSPLTQKQTENKKVSSDSTILPSLTFALLLSSPSLVDLVAPRFPMKTLGAEQKAQYLGRGGRDVLGRGLRSQFSPRLTGF